MIVIKKIGMAAMVLAIAATNSAGDNATDPEETANPEPDKGKLIWSAEFDGPLDLSTSDHVGQWRPNDFWQDINVGYKDFGADCWCINPNQHPLNNPFSVSDGVLTITATRTPKEIMPDIEALLGSGNAPKWSGGMLISEKRKQTFKYGYFEIRARWPNPGKGMFPAIWLYIADGRKIEDPRKSGAEIDILEILGTDTGRPYKITVHQRDYQNKGREIDGGTFDKDTTDWHTYGLDWQPEHLRFYYDGVMVKEITGANASWFDVEMGIRLNFVVDNQWIKKRYGRASDETTPAAMQMQVDYVRVYSTFLHGRQAGMPCPTPVRQSFPADTPASGGAIMRMAVGSD